jgi:hypothetical protein
MFEVEDYMILKQSEFKGKVAYIVDLTIKGAHNAVKGDEIGNVPGESWFVTGVSPEKISIIGGTMNYPSQMVGLWRIGNHYKFES